jgi:NTP pyrophosphatase (non-canonical NTP hydrolase)|tara:strand:- start:244 stop:567 length:324 start_codon:yes stop_codon:yes gene_type:complete
MIKDTDDELMVITMEECGELIQACSKAMRTREYSSQQLTEEVGDVMCMVGLLMQYGLIDEKEVEERVSVKLAKLAKWSYLVDDNEEYKEKRNDDRRRSTKRGNRSRR